MFYLHAKRMGPASGEFLNSLGKVYLWIVLCDLCSDAYFEFEKSLPLTHNVSTKISRLY